MCFNNNSSQLVSNSGPDANRSVQWLLNTAAAAPWKQTRWAKRVWKDPLSWREPQRWVMILWGFITLTLHEVIEPALPIILKEVSSVLLHQYYAEYLLIFISPFFSCKVTFMPFHRSYFKIKIGQCISDFFLPQTISIETWRDWLPGMTEYPIYRVNPSGPKISD